MFLVGASEENKKKVMQKKEGDQHNLDDEDERYATDKTEEGNEGDSYDYLFDDN